MSLSCKGWFRRSSYLFLGAYLFSFGGFRSQAIFHSSCILSYNFPEGRGRNITTYFVGLSCCYPYRSSPKLVWIRIQRDDLSKVVPHRKIHFGGIERIFNLQLLYLCSDRLQSALEAEDGHGLEQLLGILDLVVRTPALSAAGLTPLTVQLSLQLAQPILRESASTVVQEAYFRLVYR